MARALENAPVDLEATPYSTWSWPALDREVCDRGACTRPKRRPRRRNGTYVDPWYPEEKIGAERAVQAREACLGCPVTSACLERQLRLEAEAGVAYGIAGSVSQKRRRAILARTGWTWPAVTVQNSTDEIDNVDVAEEVA